MMNKYIQNDNNKQNMRQKNKEKVIQINLQEIIQAQSLGAQRHSNNHPNNNLNNSQNHNQNSNNLKSIKLNKNVGKNQNNHESYYQNNHESNNQNNDESNNQGNTIHDEDLIPPTLMANKIFSFKDIHNNNHSSDVNVLKQLEQDQSNERQGQKDKQSTYNNQMKMLQKYLNKNMLLFSLLNVGKPISDISMLMISSAEKQMVQVIVEKNSRKEEQHRLSKGEQHLSKGEQHLSKGAPLQSDEMIRNQHLLERTNKYLKILWKVSHLNHKKQHFQHEPFHSKTQLSLSEGKSTKPKHYFDQSNQQLSQNQYSQQPFNHASSQSSNHLKKHTNQKDIHMLPEQLHSLSNNQHKQQVSTAIQHQPPKKTTEKRSISIKSQKSNTSKANLHNQKSKKKKINKQEIKKTNERKIEEKKKEKEFKVEDEQKTGERMRKNEEMRNMQKKNEMFQQHSSHDKIFQGIRLSPTLHQHELTSDKTSNSRIQINKHQHTHKKQKNTQNDRFHANHAHNQSFSIDLRENLAWKTMHLTKNFDNMLKQVKHHPNKSPSQASPKSLHHS